MSVRLVGLLVILVSGAWPAAPALADEGSSGSSGVLPNGLSIGVVPFEAFGPTGAQVPDVATLLAERLGTKGVDRVVGPVAMEAPAIAEPQADQVREWAKRSAVGVIVVGRTTRLGRKLSVDLRVRSGDNGGLLATPQPGEISRPQDLGQVIDWLADQVIQVASLGGPGRITDGRSPVSAAPAEPQARRPFRKGAPIAIKADELEAIDRPGGRRLEFTGNVRASQDDMKLYSQRLTAFYPPGGSEPDRLVAIGRVRIDRGGRVAFCDKATYYREGLKVVCEGEDAELRQHADRVRGRTIVFHLDRDVLEVLGGADVVIHPQADEAPEGEAEATSEDGTP